MKDEAVLTALIGYGFAGETFHAPLIQAVGGLELNVVASLDVEKVVRDIPHVSVETDYKAAVTRDDVDLVVIATPNDTHASLARLALEAGKHVVVDKPFTVTTQEARGLAGIANREARVLSVFHNRRWDSDFLTLQAIAREQRLGQVMHFESHIDRFRLEVRDRWREQNLPGGGLLYDLGPHLIDQALQLIGLPQKVFASVAKQRPDALVNDWFHIILEYGELRAILPCGMLAAAPPRRFEVHGTQGLWVKYGMDTQEDALRAGKTPANLKEWGHDPSPGVLRDIHRLHVRLRAAGRSRLRSIAWKKWAIGKRSLFWFCRGKAVC